MQVAKIIWLLDYKKTIEKAMVCIAVMVYYLTMRVNVEEKRS